MAKKLHHLPDAELVHIARHAAAVIGADPSAYGTTAPEIADLVALIDAFESDVIARAAALAAAKAATSRKDASRIPVIAALRKRRDVARAFGADAAKMQATGIPVSSDRSSAAATVPDGMVDTSQRLSHTIHWSDAAAAGRKRKPRGAIGLEIFVKIGDPAPGDQKDCIFLTFAISTPYRHEYKPADVGKTAHYMLRWRLRDGTVSGWSETVSATITG